MPTKKTQTPEEATPHADETAKDKEAAPESTSTAPAAEADAGATSAATEPPALADDESAADITQASPEPPPADAEGDQPLPDQTVLILRDETIAGKDYRPGETPKLRGEDVAALVARKAGDTNPKAIAAARKARNGGSKKETVIE